jgi:hypothetical protein
MFAFNRCPLFPIRKLSTSYVRIALSAVTFIINTVISIIASSRCANAHYIPFEYISVFQVCFTAAMFGLNVFVAPASWTVEYTAERKDHRGAFILLTGVLFLPGLVIGMIGLRKLIDGHQAHTKYLDIATIIFCVVTAIAAYIISGRSWVTALATAMGAVIFVYLPWYVDWALGILIPDVSGMPIPSDKVLYWLFFAAGRLPMLSF